MSDYEKLGYFYLGRRLDPASGALDPQPLLYESSDLTTHGMIVGMTGSGKTGLALGLLEEAAMDGIPALAIDPKGDLGNLLLTFPALAPADFAPWVDPAEAGRQGLTPQALAEATAATWRKGLAEWDQTGERIARLRATAAFEIFTPGSRAGTPLSLLRSFAPPPLAVLEDPEALREKLDGAVSSLLALTGSAPDPLQSREHMLLAQLLADAWAKGQTLDLAALIHAIQKPPFQQVGVFELETFFPAADRLKLAMALNALLAAPGAAAWTQGEALDIDRLHFTPEGRPRVAVLSIAHLSDAQRMSFVTALLSELVAWMRRQPGTSSLRALVYMDEIAGYFPPSANPPSKGPMLTLLKQARAFGLGVLLSTQNPVDLDYKGLGNCGTWWLGRLQAERDKLRVLDGLEGASASAGTSFDRASMDKLLSGLAGRTFLMKNVHDKEPVVFKTRWTMSYLRGPMTKEQIQKVSAARPAGTAPAAGPAAALPPPPARPALPPDVPEVFLPAKPGPGKLVYKPAALGTAKAHYVDAKLGLDVWKPLALLVPLADSDTEVDWSGGQELAGPPAGAKDPEPGASLETAPAAIGNAAKVAAWKKALAAHVYEARGLTLPRCAALKLVGQPGETRQAFAGRAQLAAREARDQALAALKAKYRDKFEALEEKLRKAQQKVEKETAQAQQKTFDTALHFGATVLGAFFGRRSVSASSIGRASSTMRSAGSAMRERGDIAAAEEDVATLREKVVALEKELEAEAARLSAGADPAALAIDEVPVSPRKSDTALGPLLLAWVPYRLDAQGFPAPALDLPGAPAP